MGEDEDEDEDDDDDDDDEAAAGNVLGTFSSGFRPIQVAGGLDVEMSPLREGGACVLDGCGGEGVLLRLCCAFGSSGGPMGAR